LVVKETRASGNYTEFTYRGDLVVKQERKQANGTVTTSIDYQYNGNNLIGQQSYDYQTGSKILFFDYKARYQGNNRVFYESKNYNRSRQLTYESTNSTEFDNNGNIVKEISKQINYLPTPRTFESMYIYQYSGKLPTRTEFYNKNTTTNTFVLTSYSLMEYDSRGNRIKQTNYSSNNTITSTTEFTYNANNSVILRINKPSNGGLISTEINEYDANNNATFYLSTLDGKKTYEVKTSYEYDAKGNIVKKTEETNNYFNPNGSGGFQPTPFVTTRETYTNEYQCPK